MKVFLIHGWSVKSTDTYSALHTQLSNHGFDLHEIHLGRYVSLDNEVEVKDISKALQKELERDHNLGSTAWREPFHIITHSTGALVVKHWVVHYYTGKYSQHKPLNNIVWLAAPHFGSRLAHHGRSMLAHIISWGDTGTKILKDLELGSEFSWDVNEQWLNPSHWQKKGIRPFNLIGDRVVKTLKDRALVSKIFPAGFEPGSDMVVRAAAGNLNFRRFRFMGSTGKFDEIGKIDSIPFGALVDFTHSNDNGIMKSITKRANINKPQCLNLALILKCLSVDSDAKYKRVARELKEVTNNTRTKRDGFAQIDFRFRDDTGQPINDYSFGLGVIVDGQHKASRTFAHKHKNLIHPNHFTVFLNLKEFEPDLTYYFNLRSESGSELLSYFPDFIEAPIQGRALTNIISCDQTTQIDVILERIPHKNLFVFHKGDDDRLPVKWNRSGEITG